MAGLNSFIGYPLVTGLLLVFSKKEKTKGETLDKPSTLSGVAQTKIGTPIPVVFGTILSKSPLIIYYGDFRADRYTETYSAHAKFNAWPIILMLLMEWLSEPKTGIAPIPHQHNVAAAGGHGVTTSLTPNPIPTKETSGPRYLMIFAQWILMWLINGRRLKTTIQKGFKYYLGWHQIVCWYDPNMRIRKLYMNENLVWEGDIHAKDYEGTFLNLSINKPDLFGGVDEGGGFIGNVRIYFGGDMQTPDAWLVSQMYQDSIDVDLRGKYPAYRPFVSIVVPTAYVGKQATIPKIWVELQNCSEDLGLGEIKLDANPAEFIHKLYTDDNWGLGEHANNLNLQSLEQMGTTLNDEGLGISGELSRKIDADSLIDDICEHIDAIRYIEPSTGKLTFKLIRNDYDSSDIIQLDDTNCSKITYNQLAWSETINHVTVSYTNREALYEEFTITDYDSANVALAGTRNTKSLSYLYFTTSANAFWAAERALAEQGYPLATMALEANRMLSNLRLGEVVLLNNKKFGIRNMFFRISDTDIGNFVDGVVRLELVQDIFGLEKNIFDLPSGGLLPTFKEPIPVTAYFYLEVCYEITHEFNTFVFAFARQPNIDQIKWTIWRQKPNELFQSTNSKVDWTVIADLVFNLDEFEEVESYQGIEVRDTTKQIEEYIFNSNVDFSEGRNGSHLLLINDEYISYSNILKQPNGNYRIRGIIRGIFDTVPKKHFTDDKVIFLRSTTYANVTTGGPVCLRGDTTTENYNITTETIDAKLDFNYLTVKAVTTTKRAERPNPPGRIRAKWFRQNTEQYIFTKIAGDLELSWQHRNKLHSIGIVSQNDSYDFYTGTPILPPTDIKYIVNMSVSSQNYSIITEDIGHTISWEDRCLNLPLNFTDNTILSIYSEHNNLSSHQKHIRELIWKPPLMVNVVQTRTQAEINLRDWGLSDRIRIPDGPLSTFKEILYSDLPIFIIGEPLTIPYNENRHLLSYSNSEFKATTTIYIAINQNTLQEYELKNGYLFGTYFIQQASGGVNYYQLINGQLVKKIVS